MKNLSLAISFLTLMFLGACSTQTNNAKMDNLNGTWELNYIAPHLASDASKSTLSEMFPAKTPTLTFDTATMKIHGNSGCNTLNGIFGLDGYKLDLSKPMAMTRMFCNGVDENAFTKGLLGVTSYDFQDGKLTLIQDDIIVMTFVKK